MGPWFWFTWWMLNSQREAVQLPAGWTGLHVQLQMYQPSKHLSNNELKAFVSSHCGQGPATVFLPKLTHSVPNSYPSPPTCSSLLIFFFWNIFLHFISKRKNHFINGDIYVYISWCWESADLKLTSRHRKPRLFFIVFWILLWRS